MKKTCVILLWLLCIFCIMSFWFFHIFCDMLLNLKFASESNSKHLLVERKLAANPTFNSSLTTAKQGLTDVKDKLRSSLLKARMEMYTIVIWDPPFGNKFAHGISRRLCGWCEITYEKEQIETKSSKAVVFHFKELEQTILPNQRRPDQFYVWFTMESPASLNLADHIDLKQYENFFNMTMTYRRDSDIYTPYERFSSVLQRIQFLHASFKDLMARKTKLALWIVSNCRNTKFAPKRIEFSDKLIQAGLKLDRKGGCFPQNGKADKNKISKYKFYMAFENTLYCKDYITEKVLTNSFEMGTVPVVYGAKKSDYEAIIPPGSFIFVEDFKTPKELVDYLNYLDKNDTAYREYFEWRTLKVEDLPNYQRTTGFCQLCRVLHGINVDNIYSERSEELGSYIPLFGYPNKSRVVPSLRDWFYGTENRECLPSY